MNIGNIVTSHEKTQWARFAQAAYKIGHRYSAAAAIPAGERISTREFDALQEPFRAWLVFDEWPAQ